MGDPSSLTNFTNSSVCVSREWVPPFQPLLLLYGIVLSAVEATILGAAAYYIPGWWNNYRNCLLLQLCFAQLLNRIVYCIEYAIFLEDVLTHNVVLFGFRVYIDLVLTILVMCFIQHMYRTLMIVIVNVTELDLYKGLMCTWLIPVPCAVFCIDMVHLEFMSEWCINVLICFLFRWPLTLCATLTYGMIVRKVFCDRRMKFARLLTVTTFFMCFIVSLNMILKDFIWLFFISHYLVISYFTELASNCLIMILYLVLFILNYNVSKEKCTLNEETDVNIT